MKFSQILQESFFLPPAGKRFSRYLLVPLMAFLIPTALAAQPKEAASPDAIAEKLNAVPVYYLERNSGKSHTVDAGPDKPAVAPVFFYSGSASSLRDDLLTKTPPIETSLVRAGLGKIYLNMRNPEKSDFRYALIADPTQVDAARRITGNEDFNETPVFAVRQKEEGGFLTMKNPDGTVALPLFIESQRAYAALNIVLQQNKDMDGKLAVSALPLQTAINDMIGGRLEANAVVFIPPQ